MRFVTVVLAMMVLAACGERTDPDLRQTTLPLGTYVGKLRYVETTGPFRGRLLFDTGGGLTLLGPSAASAAACRPYKQLATFRMNGDRFDVDGCGTHRLEFGGLAVEPEIGAFDLKSLLPPELPPLDGLASLQTFAGRVVTLDLRQNRLTVANEVDGARANRMTPITIRLAGSAGGAGLDVFVRVRGKQGPLWFEVDSGNLEPVLVSTRVLAQLDLSPEQIARLGQGAVIDTPLIIDGLPPMTQGIKSSNLIYDGALNAATLEKLVLLLDLRKGAAWASVNPGDAAPNPSLQRTPE